MTNTVIGSRPPFTLPLKIAYGFGSVAFGAKNILMSTLLLLYYNQIVGLPPHWVSLALSLTVLFDAFWDPFIGQLSDNWRSRWGRRHPFMYISAIPAAVTLFMLFNPPVGLGWSDEWMLAYMLVMALLAKSTISLYEVPATALTPELAPDYHERTQLLSFRTFFSVLAGATMAVLALLVFLKDTVGPDGSRIPGQLYQPGYAPYALTTGLIMIGSIMVASLATHRYIPYLHQPPVRKISFVALAREVAATLSNRNFLVLTLSALITGLGAGLGSGLQIYFITYFWKLGASQLVFILLGTVVASICAVFVAPAVSKAFGKRNACVGLMFASLCISVLPLSLRLLGVIPDSWIGTDLLAGFLLVDRVIAGVMGVSGGILVASMIADVVEESQVATGRRSEGLLLSADSLLQKVVGALASIVPGFLLAFVGMPEKANPDTLDPDIMRNLALIYLPLTASFSAIAIVVITLYKIDHQAHEDNLRRLRDAAAARERAEQGEAVPPEL